MWKLLAILVILTGCQSTQKSLIPCEELSATVFNEAHDDFLLQSCYQNIQTMCDDPESDCTKDQFLLCVEQHLGLKKVQIQHFRAQKCWHGATATY